MNHPAQEPFSAALRGRGWFRRAQAKSEPGEMSPKNSRIEPLNLFFPNYLNSRKKQLSVHGEVEQPRHHAPPRRSEFGGGDCPQTLQFLCPKFLCPLARSSNATSAQRLGLIRVR